MSATPLKVGDKVRLLFGAYGYGPGLPRAALKRGDEGVVVDFVRGVYVVDFDGWRAKVPADALEAVQAAQP